MKNNITSLCTGPDTWLEIYDDTSYSGNALQIGPNQRYPDLDTVARGDGDWKNQIQSFRLYHQSEQPLSWTVGVDVDAFRNAYPGEFEDDKLAGQAIRYQTQDANYRIYLPVIDYPDPSSMAVRVQIDNIIDASTDDHSNLTLTFDADGKLNQVQQDWSAGSTPTRSWARSWAAARSS